MDPPSSLCTPAGHGECQGGFCKCHTGWYGQDCAFVPPARPGPQVRRLCLRRLCLGQLCLRPNLRLGSPHGLVIACPTSRVCRHAQPCTPRRPPPTVACAGMEEGDRPWLKPHVHTPAARDPQPGQTRKRPLIYVYELPPFYNAVMLQVCARHGGGVGEI